MQSARTSTTFSTDNPRLVEFIETKLDTLAKWDIIQFFYHNPKLVGPAPKIASLIGRDLRHVESLLKEMAVQGLLDVHEKSGVRLFQLSTRRDVQSMVEQFVTACDDRRFREAAIYHTLSKR